MSTIVDVAEGITVNRELAAMKTCYEALEDLSPEAQTRVILAVRVLLGLVPPAKVVLDFKL